MEPYYEHDEKEHEEMVGYMVWMLIISLGVGALYCAYKGLTHNCPEPQTVVVKEIMSIREQQTFLNAQGHSRYDCGEVDGKPGPLLFKALDNYICDRNYKESTYGL